MKKIMLIAVAGILTNMCVAGPVSFRVEFEPLGFIYGAGADLEISKTVGPITQTYSLEDGAAAYMGSLQGGVQIDTKVGYLDILAGGAMLILPGADAENFPVSGAFLFDVGYRFKLNQEGTITIGPFIGILAPGDAVLELEDETGAGDDIDSFDLEADGGIQAGVKFCAGGEHVCFNMKIGYADLSYEVVPDDDPAWTISYGGDTELDMSGMFAQFGLSAQF